MEKYKYMCDMGSIKILLRDGSIFFMNDFGDGIHNVFICDNQKEIKEETDFKGHFTIFTKGYLMYSDCDNEQAQHTFNKGRYFVELSEKDKTTFYIYKVDEDLHA